MDIYPTLATFAQTEIPDDRIIDGIDMSESLLNPDIRFDRKNLFFCLSSYILKTLAISHHSKAFLISFSILTFRLFIYFGIRVEGPHNIISAPNF